AVEAKHAPELRCVVDLQELERRLPALDERPGEIDAARLVEFFEDFFGHEKGGRREAGGWRKNESCSRIPLSPASRLSPPARSSYATRFFAGRSRPRWMRSISTSAG